MVGEKMDKEEKYSNRMRLPKDGAILAENDNIVLKAVSEDQKYHMLSVSFECSFLKHEFENETGVLPVKRTMKNNKFFSVSLLTGWRYFYAAFNVSS